MELVTKTFFVISVVLMVLAIVGIYLHHSFVSLLKKSHHEKWEELGRPGLVMNRIPIHRLFEQVVVYRVRYRL